MGQNLTSTIISSGTYAAAVRTLTVQLAPKALILSWFAPTKYILMDHHMGHDTKPYLKYPGKAAAMIIEEAIRKDLWKSKLVNVNFPQKPSLKIKFTKPLLDATVFYKYPPNIDYKTKTFTYPYGFIKKNISIKYDVGAINKGYISITSIDPFMTFKRSE